MCGIVGALGAPDGGTVDWVERALVCLDHRGPDDRGLWRDPAGQAVLGHTRLAIFDLSEGGHQPMASADGKVHVVFNGEIYNHRSLRKELEADGMAFRSTSDTEVLLQAYRAWGERCLTRLNGMFAFVILDQAAGLALMARDRAGEKPLYYSLRSGTLTFASEVKALLCDPAQPRRLDMTGVNGFLAFGRSPPDQSLVQDIRKLEAGSALTFRLKDGHLRKWKYWELPPARPDAGPERDGALLDELEALLEDSVRLQMAADVPVGVLLSGGVDSSLVTALSVRHCADVRTFTLTLPDAPAINEGSHARLIADAFGTRHHEVELRWPEVGLLEQLGIQYDDPIADSSMIPTHLVSKAVREHCTVAVGGDAGDEQFGGYRVYNAALRRKESAGWVPRRLERVVGALALRTLPLGVRGRGVARNLAAGFGVGHWPQGYLFGPGERAALLPATHPPTVAPEVRWRHLVTEQNSLDAALRGDFLEYLSDDLLVKVDRASMLVSLEVRAPLLDHRIIEFAFSRVPERLKADGQSLKILLHRLAQRLLPSQFVQNRKQGFSVPIADWILRPDWWAFFRAVLLDDPSSPFDRRMVERLMGAAAKRRSVAPHLFGLTMFELWRRHYRLTL